MSIAVGLLIVLVEHPGQFDSCKSAVSTEIRKTSIIHTGRASRNCAIFAGTAICSDIVARTAVAAQKAASKVEEFTNDNSYLSLIGARRLELASNGAVHAVARVVVGSRGQGGASEL